MRGRRVSSLIGLVVGGLGVAFVAVSLLDEWDRVVALSLDARPSWLGAGFLFGLAGMTIIGLGWRRALQLVGHRAAHSDALRWYFVGQLGKYVPGGVWAVVGSAELAVGGGTTRARSYGAMVLALGATYLAGIMVVAAVLPFHPELLERAPWAALCAALVPLGLAATHPVVVRRAGRVVERLARRNIALEVPPWGAAVRLTLMHLPAWGAVGLANWCLVRGLGADASVSAITLAAVLAWVIGFLIVPAPGGLGVREAVFVLTATPLSSGVAAAVAVLSRILFMLVDLVAAACLSVLGARRDGGPPGRSGQDHPREVDGVQGSLRR